MRMEHWWNDTDRGKPKYMEENFTWCHFVYHNPHVGIAAIEPWFPR